MAGGYVPPPREGNCTLKWEHLVLLVRWKQSLKIGDRYQEYKSPTIVRGIAPLEGDVALRSSYGTVHKHGIDTSWNFENS